MMAILDIIVKACAGVALVALPFLVVGWIRKTIKTAQGKKTNDVFVFASSAVFSLAVLGGLCLGFFGKSFGQVEFKRTMISITGDAHVSINGVAVSNSKEIVSALKSLHSVRAHHSNPTQRIAVDVSDGSQGLLLFLARDSGDPREYWVFFPRHWITGNNEIGRIETPVFDTY